MTTVIVGPDECEDLLDHRALIKVLAEAHRQLAVGGAVQPIPTAMRAPGSDAADGVAAVPMCAYAPYLDLVAVKVLIDAPANRHIGQPAQRSTISLVSASTGECLALLDGRVVTRIRTAAASALATDLLAPRDARVLGLLGSGALAGEHVRALRTVRDFDEVVVWSRTPAAAARLVEEITAAGLTARAAPHPQEVAAASDVLCTLTPSTDPILRACWIRPGTHINAVGSPPRPAFCELGPDVFARADIVVVDSASIAAAESGNVRGAIAAGTLLPDLVELGQVITGTARGRTAAHQVSVFNSVGLGLQDLAAAAHLLATATARGLGHRVEAR